MEHDIRNPRWEINPYLGVGPLSFTQTKEESRLVLGGNMSTFRKGPYSSRDTDAFDDLCTHIDYDKNQLIECIECFGTAQVFFKNISLLGVPVEDVLAALTHLEIAYRYDDGYFIDEGGFALYAPMGMVEAVTVYRRGYYDDE